MGAPIGARDVDDAVGLVVVLVDAWVGPRNKIDLEVVGAGGGVGLQVPRLLKLELGNVDLLLGARDSPVWAVSGCLARQRSSRPWKMTSGSLPPSAFVILCATGDALAWTAQGAQGVPGLAAGQNLKAHSEHVSVQSRAEWPVAAQIGLTRNHKQTRSIPVLQLPIGLGTLEQVWTNTEYKLQINQGRACIPIRRKQRPSMHFCIMHMY